MRRPDSLTQAVEASTAPTMAANTPTSASGPLSTASGLPAGTSVRKRVSVKPMPPRIWAAALQKSGKNPSVWASPYPLHISFCTIWL